MVLNKPIYIFHHIPKCGGTSVRKALAKRFIILSDYRPINDSFYIKNKINIKKIRFYNCLVGHYGTSETHVYKRYPEFYKKNKYRIFTFIREPLSLRISLYYYEKTHNIINKDRLLTEELELRPNYIANILGCNTDNYKEKINSSFFIGIFEKINESFKLFVKLIESKEVTLPKENVSQKDKQEKNFTSQQIKNFKENNKLDYLIWDYCLKKYETLKNKYL